jgi:hypothetical protein
MPPHRPFPSLTKTRPLPLAPDGAMHVVVSASDSEGRQVAKLLNTETGALIALCQELVGAVACL